MSARAFLRILVQPNVVNSQDEAIEMLRQLLDIADEGRHADAVLFGLADRLGHRVDDNQPPA